MVPFGATFNNIIFREATITLQDVQIIWALPIDGEPVTGLDLDRTTIEWQDYCLTYLGFRPDATAFKGSRLQTHAIISHIAQVEITYDTPHEIVVQYARAVALLLLGGVMCPDSSGNLIPLLYLTKLEDIVEARNYSWGSAVLAFLYRELCNATNKGKAAIGGALQLLQIWAWSRIIPLCPGLGAERVYMGQVQTDNNRLLQQHHMVQLGTVSTPLPGQYEQLSVSLEIYWMRCSLISLSGSRMTWTQMSLWLTQLPPLG
ncbi:UNVERIFIED_CONTAM: protein MAINTENANCE OF MERISTEMS [Sesamum radiatum]|uniref:Protein MAINTENANCE OF MERISTEMS n=1 Tax=Sesamum radiatum TaxID=300843 RepID=A0AAW2QIM4_SESRA